MCEKWRCRTSVSGILGDISWTSVERFSGLCVLNLPRQERYKRENMILVGIIPGPHEPSLNINHYLTPIVRELQEFHRGVQNTSVSENGCRFKTVTLKMALLGVFCDLPASREVCGFCSFSALHGCNKYMKAFPTESFGEKPDFSGYESSTWPVCDIAIHREVFITSSCFYKSPTKINRKRIWHQILGSPRTTILQPNQADSD